MPVLPLPIVGVPSLLDRRGGDQFGPGDVPHAELFAEVAGRRWPPDELAGGPLLLLVSHVVVDVLLQTDWQALAKVGGLGDPRARRALFRHVSTYTLAFVPALVWIGGETRVVRAVALGAFVAVPICLSTTATSCAPGCATSSHSR
jgi:hypothetical protein